MYSYLKKDGHIQVYNVVLFKLFFLACHCHNKPGKGPFWREQENAAKHGAKLKTLAGNSQMEMLYKCSMFLIERKGILLLLSLI